MYLTIDRGNSRTKLGVFDANGQLVHKESAPLYSIEELQEIISNHAIEHLIVSTTGKSDWVPGDIRLNGISIELSHKTKIPIEIIYTTPETLGRDRIAAACGAHFKHPDTNCLIVDAGTCITMDLLLAKGIWLGGNIAPGIRMRLESMHEKTARLPLADPGFPELSFGDSTIHALQNGACLGAIMEIEGILNRANKAYGNVLVVITGGDADLLAKELESQIFVEPELVTHGLFQILAFNVKNFT